MRDPHTRLEAWIKAHDAAALARVCGVSAAMVRRWGSKQGKRPFRPPEHLRRAIFVLTGILPVAWRTPEEARAARAAAAAAVRLLAARPKAPPLGLRKKKTSRQIARERRRKAGR